MADGSIGSASRRLLLIAAMGVLVFLVAWTGLLLTRFNGDIASIWLANAVAVAILLRSPKQRWPELIAAAVAANIAARIVNGDTAVHGLTLALVNMIEIGIVVVTMRRRFGPDMALGEVRPLGFFILFGGLVAPLLSGLGAAFYLATTEGVAALPLYEHWVLAHSLGLLAVTPLLLAVPTSRFSLPSIDRHLFEPAAILLGTALVTALVYTQTAPLQAIIILCLLVAAFRLPSGGAAVAVALVAVEGVVLTSLGSGPVASSLADPYERMLALQAFLAVAVLVTLPVSAIIGERDRLLAVAVLARDEARAATHAKSNFLAMISHEIRTPMTGVLGMIELLHSNPPKGERERYFSSLKQSATLLMTVLDDVLDYSKFESGQFTLDATDFDFEELAQSTLDLFGNAASKKGLLISMTFDCAGGAIVHGDPVRLQQVMCNLISNAIKFTDHGHVTIAIRSTALDKDRKRWRFEVKDSGIGIAKADLDRLFRPFVQADSSTSRRFGGTGLGLAISRWLVKAMGGTLAVESHFGGGSTFWFEVALPDGEAIAWHKLVAAPLPLSRALEILVAEDNPVNQMLIAAILRRMGHAATLVENGRLAVEAAKDRPFDCILMDMQMPEMDGLAATRAIRASGGPCAAVPIIALTADASPERRRFYDNAGLTGYLAKPIDQAALAARLAAIGGEAKAMARADAPETTSEAALLDKTHINQLCAAIGPARFDQLVTLLAKELVDRPTIIRRAVLAGDFARARSESHSLKGATMSVGAMALGQAAAALELAPDVAAMNLALADLDRQVARTRQAIATLLPPSLPNRRAG